MKTKVRDVDKIVTNISVTLSKTLQDIEAENLKKTSVKKNRRLKSQFWEINQFSSSLLIDNYNLLCSNLGTILLFFPLICTTQKYQLQTLCKINTRQLPPLGSNFLIKPQKHLLKLRIFHTRPILESSIRSLKEEVSDDHSCSIWLKGFRISDFFHWSSQSAPSFWVLSYLLRSSLRQVPS